MKEESIRSAVCRFTGARTRAGISTLLDAIDEDEKEIGRIADRLQRRGYEVMRRGITARGGFITSSRRTGSGGEPRRTIRQPGIDQRRNHHEIEAHS